MQGTFKKNNSPRPGAPHAPTSPITLSGAQIIVGLLERWGIRTVAGIPGGAILPLYDALSHSTRIRHVLARHEQGATFMAQGMARVSGQAAVCLASSGPGATNLITGIADAKLDSIPIVCITGQVPVAMIGTDAFQEVDICTLARPITKYCVQARSAAELLDIVPRALEIAVSGRPGPVLIDVPKDIQVQTATFAAWPAPSPATPAPAPDAATLHRAAALINTASRPVLYLGGGIIHSGASALAVELAERASLPVTTTLLGLGALPSDHPLNLGMLGMHGARCTNLALQECDLLIAVGARFDDRATGHAAKFCPGARIVHIDMDARELNKIKTADVAIKADAAAALSALLPQITTRPRIHWLSRVADLKREHPLRMPGADDPLAHYGLIRAVAAALDGDEIITTDVGQHQMWAAQAYPLRRPRRWLTSGGLGTMGFGLPAAIGAALAEPERTVVCFSGDGSILMNIQELATAVEENLNIKIVLMDNGALGLVHQQQDMFYARRQFASTFRARTDFASVARGFGVHAVSLGDEADPGAALKRALQRPGPVLIHAPIDAAQKVFPMVPPGAANSEMIDG
jgi:acetolactate synthase-1/2/3 large subunit